jgi:simple sugar transport system ATP-binding protein
MKSDKPHVPSKVREIRLQGITKHFGSIQALAGVDFSLHAGEVHALLGENGAGKSTLMKILFGLYRPDQGGIYFDGQPARIDSAHTAAQLGLGFVQQHFSLVDTLTVAENVVLGALPTRFYHPRRLQKQVQKFIDAQGLGLDAGAQVDALAVGEKQRVEIIKALYRNAAFIIFDEPTSVLAPQEVRTLFATIRQLQAAGKSIVFITHKLDEILEISNRITILRAGKDVATIDTSAATAKSLARSMLGEITPPFNRDDGKTTRRDESNGPARVLKIANVKVRHDRGHLAVNEVSFEMRAGEILGVAGIDGSGQRELAEAIMGLRTVQAGMIKWELLKAGTSLPNNVSTKTIGPTDKICQRISQNPNPLAAFIRWKIFSSIKQKLEMPIRDFDRRRIGFIPPDRMAEAFVAEFSVADNLVLERSDDAQFRRAGFLAPTKIDCHARQVVEEFNVLCKSPAQRLGELSGGNQQKLLLGRALSTNPEVLIAMNPTWGVDVAATAAIHQRLRQMRERGGAVLLFSTDLEEIYALCDRFFVLHAGRLMGWATLGTSTTQVGLWMAGRKNESSFSEAAPIQNKLIDY